VGWVCPTGPSMERLGIFQDPLASRFLIVLRPTLSHKFFKRLFLRVLTPTSEVARLKFPEVFLQFKFGVDSKKIL
jgi:hypothetical protein